MSTTVASMSGFGDTRTRDVYNRNVFQAAKPASDSKVNKAEVNHVLYGITAADSEAAIGADTQFELVKFTATESTADALVGQLDVSVNTGGAGSTKVAELSSANAKFITSNLKADFGSNLVMNMTTSGSAVTQTFSTTASSANDVVMTASSNNLVVTVPTETRFATSKANLDFGSSKSMYVTSGASNVVQTFTTSGTAGQDVSLTTTASSLDIAAATQIKQTTATTKTDFGTDMSIVSTTAAGAVKQTFASSATSAEDVVFTASPSNLVVSAATETRFATSKANVDFGSSKSMYVTSGASNVVQTFTTSGTSAQDVALTTTASSLDIAAATLIKQTTATATTDFGSNKTIVSSTNGSAVVQKFTTAAAGVGDVSLTATANNLLVTASNTDFSGEATVRGDRINWFQNGGSETRVASNMEYIYTHGDGLAGSSTGFMNFTLDGQNANLALMGAGGMNFKSYNAAGASETVLAMGAGAAAGQQSVQFSNSYMGINATPSTTYRLDVGGAARVDGNLSVSGDLFVSGTVTTIDSTTVQVEDKNIAMAYSETDPALFDGGGITVGSGASAATFDYNNTLVAWDSNISMNLPTSKEYLIADGANTTLNTGVSISESGILFGSDDAQIAFGTAAVITKTGLSALSDEFAVTFGASKQWRIIIQDVGGSDYLSMQYSDDVGVTYTTKFSVSN